MPFGDVKPMLAGSKRYKGQLEDVAHDRDVDQSGDEPARHSDEYYRKLDKERDDVFKNAPPRQR